MRRQATQELGGWKSSDVVEKLYNKSLSEEVVLELRAALRRASGRLEVNRRFQELEESVTSVGTGEGGLTRSTHCRQ